MKKQILTVIFALLTTLSIQAQVFIGDLDPVEKSDTLLVGFFREADTEQYNALMAEWNTMTEKESQSQAAERNKEDMKKYTSDAAQTEVARLEKQRADALKELDKAAGRLPADQVAKMKKDINSQFDRMIKEIPGQYADVSQKMKEQNASIKQYDTSEFSPEKKYALKRRFAALAIDGKLHGYSRTRNFRHGRAAVCREVHKPENGMTLQHWGFVDESAREVVPCIYFKVNDFNNVSDNASVFASREDADARGWTTVWKSAENGLVQGMIDKDGNEKIPCKFAVREKYYQRIIFQQTPWGEFAQVSDAATEKCGIIDRQGNYTLQPTEAHRITWYTDLQCFGYRTDEGKQVTFDAYGKTVNPPPGSRPR